MICLRPKFVEIGSQLSRPSSNGILLDRMEEFLSRDQLLEERELVRVGRVIVFLLGVFEIFDVVVEVSVVDGAFAVRLLDARRSVRLVAWFVCDVQLRLV